MKHRTLDVPYVALGNLRKEIARYLRYHMPVLQIENHLYRKLQKMTLPRASSGSAAHRRMFSPCCRQEGRHLDR